MNINMKINAVYVPYLSKPQYTQIYFGGASSGKSFFIAQKIILDNLQGINWLICRKVGATIRKSVYNQVVKTIYALGVGWMYNINKSEMVLTCRANGKQIMFVGLDNVEKIKSTTPARGVLERVFIEEATEIKRDDYLQLKKRLRGKSEHSKHIFMAFNPILKSHWIYKDFFAGKWAEGGAQYSDDDVSILKTTYRDNVFLTQGDRAQLENETDPYFYNVYTLGNWGTLAGVIYRNVHETPFDIGTVAKMPGVKSVFGLDFGYTNDPTALFCGLCDAKNRVLYVFDEIYEKGLVNAEIAERIQEKGYAKEKIIADSAEPKSIEELYRSGIRRIEGAIKGSVVYGIQKLMRYTIVVHPRCVNFMREAGSYAWQIDKHGDSINKPTDDNNHLMDAMRYAMQDIDEGGRFEFLNE